MAIVSKFRTNSNPQYNILYISPYSDVQEPHAFLWPCCHTNDKGYKTDKKNMITVH